jgi:plastocyanin
MLYRKVATAALVAMTSVVLTSSAAHAVIAAAVPQSFQLGFATPVVVAPVGGPVTFVNSDTIPHNFQADGVFLSKKKAKKTDWCNLFPSKECPIFYSDAVGQGQTADVQGLENTKAGQQYAFMCLLHPNMKGTLYIQ